MDLKLSPTQADSRHDGEMALPAPKDIAAAEEALSKLALIASDRRPAAGSDFSAGPRVTEPSPDVTLRAADPTNDPLRSDQTSPGRRASRSLAGFLLAACIGVAATLAWQSYGGVARQVIAGAAPPLGWLAPPPATTPSSGRESTIEQPGRPAVQASAQPASAPAEPIAATASEPAASTTPAGPSPELQQLATMARDLAAVRQSVEQLAAVQGQMAREIAKLQTAGQDIRRRISALPPAAVTARKPVVAPQLVPPPQAAPQPSAASAPPATQPAPQSSSAPLPPTAPLPPALAEPPSRPPMPVR
jgi:hypothetical protein